MFVPLSVLEFRDRAALFFGDKVGIIDGERQFTYRAFAERTHRLANALRGIGVGAGDRVSFITYNTHQLLEAYYGVLEAGAVLNPINIRLAAHEIAFILDHAASRVVVFHHDFLPLIEQIGPRLASRPTFVVLEGDAGGLVDHEYEALLAGGSADPLHPEIDENGLAELFYTSGTTGMPKGVAMTHRELYLHSLVAEVGLGFDQDDVVLHVVPLFHVNGWGTPHFVTMIGGRHVMLRRFDPGALMELVERHRVTRLLAVPTIFNAILNHRERSSRDLTSLRQVIIGGAPASPALVASLEAELGVQAIVGYGLTETSPIITLAQPRSFLTEHEPAERRQERQSMTGWAIPGVAVRVVDGDGHDVRPDGEQIGEIVVRSNLVMDGYYRDPDATAKAIRGGWLHTGDMATIDEAGYVLIKDRSKDIIISAGENISSVEIEVALGAHPAVLECAVIAAPDDKRGEVPVAFVVLKPDQTVSASDLRAFCREGLAGFKVPRQIQFRDALPKGGTGKILKAELREPFWVGRSSRVN
ncbi:MAG TPA: fatty acid--CoA ligase [Candidatus Limnocylindrales bacterium]|nr:fatty acid--CoA ligase [Candidatus Limnocylindrales bacterium]